MRILFLSSHVGLGHVTRDLSIAEELSRMRPSIKIDWCTATPALDYLEARGAGGVLDCCRDLESFSEAIESIFNVTGYRLSSLRRHLWILGVNYEKLSGCVDLEGYDLVFADEFWEVVLRGDKALLEKTVFATDFVYKPYEPSPLQFMISLILNRYFKRRLPMFRSLIYLNSLDETVRGRWYPLIGERVDKWIERHMFVAGLATSYPPGSLPGRGEARETLGIGGERLLTVIIGGTRARSPPFIRRVVEAFQEYRRRWREREDKLLVITGPRTPVPPDMRVPGVVWETLVPDMRTIYAASDAFVVRPGRTTTADIECLPWPRPAILVPIKGHFEHKMIAFSLSTHHPGRFYLVEENIQPTSLAEKIEAMLAYKPEEHGNPRDKCMGATRTAQHILGLIAE